MLSKVTKTFWWWIFYQTDLVHAGKLQWIKQWNKQKRCHDNSCHLPKHIQVILRPLGIHFRRGSQNQNSWQKRYQDAGGYRHNTHFPVPHQELPCCFLLPSRKGMINPNACWDDESDDEDGPIGNFKIMRHILAAISADQPSFLLYFLIGHFHDWRHPFGYLIYKL